MKRLKALKALPNLRVLILKTIKTHNSKFYNNNNINTANGQVIVPSMNPILVSANCPPTNKIQNNSCSAISNDIVNKIKKNLEQKAFMISKQQNVKKFFRRIFQLNEACTKCFLNFEDGRIERPKKLL